MVYESRVGDVFTLGSSSWRIEEITHDRVLVTPGPRAAGQAAVLARRRARPPGRARAGRSARSSASSARLDDDAARQRARAAGLDAWAADNLLAYLREQQEATRHVPDDRTIVVERFRDELGDWRVVVHSPFGGQVHAPWALAVAARFRERFGVDVQAMHGDDGLVLRLPDVETDDGSAPDVADLVLARPGRRRGPGDRRARRLGAVRGPVPGVRRRGPCCCPGARPGKRQPLWQQRQRAAQLLQVASRYGSFPIVLETVRECLQDVFDVPGLAALMRDLGRAPGAGSSRSRHRSRRRSRAACCSGTSPSSSTRATRRSPSAARPRSPSTRPCWPSCSAAARARRCATCSTRPRWRAPRRELQRLAPARRLRGAEGVADLLRLLGPLTTAEVARPGCASGRPDDEDAGTARDVVAALAGRARGGPPA